MGKGKGKFNSIVGNILKYQIVIEFTTLDFFFFGAPIHSAMTKLPFRSKLVFDKNRKSYVNFDQDLNIDGLGRCSFKDN
jgi:ribosomal protein L16/L10AE